MRSSRRDASCVWHGLDLSLKKFREALPGLKEAGRDDLLELLEELIDGTAAGREEAEREVAATLGDSAEGVGG